MEWSVVCPVTQTLTIIPSPKVGIDKGGGEAEGGEVHREVSSCELWRPKQHDETAAAAALKAHQNSHSSRFHWPLWHGIITKSPTLLPSTHSPPLPAPVHRTILMEQHCAVHYWFNVDRAADWMVGNWTGRRPAIRSCCAFRCGDCGGHIMIELISRFLKWDKKRKMKDNRRGGIERLKGVNSFGKWNSLQLKWLY